MKAHSIFFILVKLLFIIQFIFIIFGKHSEDTTTYLLTDFIFKMSIGIYLMLFFYLNNVTDIYLWDKVVISFAGTLLSYDSFYNVLPKVFLKYGIVFNPFSPTNMFTRLSKMKESQASPAQYIQ
jgi:hypothetical protein